MSNIEIDSMSEGIDTYLFFEIFDTSQNRWTQIGDSEHCREEIQQRFDVWQAEDPAVLKRIRSVRVSSSIEILVEGNQDGVTDHSVVGVQE